MTKDAFLAKPILSMWDNEGKEMFGILQLQASSCTSVEMKYFGIWKPKIWDFPGGPAAKILYFHYGVCRFDPWLGN